MKILWRFCVGFLLGDLLSISALLVPLYGLIPLFITLGAVWDSITACFQGYDALCLSLDHVMLLYGMRA